MVEQSWSRICIIVFPAILVVFLSQKTFLKGLIPYKVGNRALKPLLYGSSGNISLTNTFVQSLSQNNQVKWEELSNIILSSPWLFPKSRALFPYLGMHNNLDLLLETMAYKSKKIMILAFNSHWQPMVQNNIYTLVRFTRTSNYIIAAGDELTLIVCMELNLPCYNTSSYMSKFSPNISKAHEALLDDPYYLAMVWYLLPFCLDILRRGYTLMKSDADISYTAKDIWKRFELMVNQTGADIIFMREKPVNGGFFYATPNDRVIAFFEKWIASQRFFKNINDQTALERLQGRIYMVCSSRESCNHVKTVPMNPLGKNQQPDNNRASKMAALLTFPSWFAGFDSGCPPNQRINPCDENILYVHPICITGIVTKINKLKTLGFWLMNDPCVGIKLNTLFEGSKSAKISLVRCVPAPRLSPAVEHSFLHCNN